MTKTAQILMMDRKIAELQAAAKTGSNGTLIAQRLRQLRRERVALLTGRYVR